MKRLVIGMSLVLAFSSSAFALNMTSVSVTLRGQNTWTDGKLTVSKSDDENTFNLSASGTDWTANAIMTAHVQPASGSNMGNPTFKLDDVYIKQSKQPFTLEIWNWGEDGQGVDYKTPLEFVYANDAPDSNWAARLTTDMWGNNTVLQIKNAGAAPDYFMFTQRPVGTNTVGAAYRTFFNHRNIADAWATVNVGTAKVTGEVATVTTPVATGDQSKLDLGGKVELPTNITLLARKSEAHVAGTENYTTTYLPLDAAPAQTYIEANYHQTARASYTYDSSVTDSKLNVSGEKRTYDLRLRKSNDQSFDDIWNVDHDLFDINVSGDNDWLKDKGWAFGLNLTNQQGVVINKNGSTTAPDLGAAHSKFTTAVLAQVAPNNNSNVLARMINVNVENVPNAYEDDYRMFDVHGYYKATNKLTLLPQIYVNEQRPTSSNGAVLTGVGAYEKGYTVGTYAHYALVKGMLMGGVWSHKPENNNANFIVEAGYEISF